MGSLFSSVVLLVYSCIPTHSFNWNDNEFIGKLGRIVIFTILILSSRGIVFLFNYWEHLSLSVVLSLWRSHTCLIQFISTYFMIFVLLGIFYPIKFSIWLLLEYKEDSEFSIFVFYLAIFLSSLNYNSFSLDSFEFCRLISILHQYLYLYIFSLSYRIDYDSIVMLEE